MKNTRKNFSKTFFLIAAAVLLSLLSFLYVSTPARAGERKNFSFYFTFEGNTATAGHGAAELKELMVLTVRKIMEKTNTNIQPMIVPAWTDILKKVKSGKVDFMLFYPHSYIELRKQGLNLHPMFSVYLGFDEKSCIYVNKKSHIKNIKGLKGRKIALSNSYIRRFTNYPPDNRIDYIAQLNFISDFIELQYILNNNGMGSLSSSGMSFAIDYPNYDSKLIALDRNLVDAALLTNSVVEINRAGGNPLKNLEPLYCSPIPVHSMLVVSTDSMAASVSSKLTKAAMDTFANPDDETKDLIKRSNMQVGKAKFIPFTDSDLKYYYDIMDAYHKNNWRPEIEAVVNKLIEESKKQ
jgi:ABC-type phosphate/phosphonate transport system substrate-binding protein